MKWKEWKIEIDMEKEIKLPYLTNEALESLHSEYDYYKKHYQEPNPDWFIEEFKKHNYICDSELTFNDFRNQLITDNSEPKQNYKNIQIIYENLRFLTPAQAAEEKLWAALAHTYLYKFIQKTWQKEIAKNEKSSTQNAFLFTNGKRRGIFINSIAKLWWAGYLTFDTKNPNPYHLTEVIGGSAFRSTMFRISSSNFTSNRNVLHGLLACMESREKVKSEHYIAALKYLNAISGVLLLDSLSQEEITQMLHQNLNQQHYS